MYSRMRWPRRAAYSDAVKGIYPDGWTSERIVVTWSAGAARRSLRLTLRGPDWLPWTHQRLRLLHDRQRTQTINSNVAR